MRAPVITFAEHLVRAKGAVRIYTCNNHINDGRCNAQILQAVDVKTRTLNIVCAEDDDCINVYDEPTDCLVSSAIPIDGSNILCLKCNGLVGFRMGSRIAFNPIKLREMILYSYSHLLSDIVYQLD